MPIVAAVKYSTIRKQFEAKKGKSFEVGVDALTHLWQADDDDSKNYFKTPAEVYVSAVNEPGIQYELNIEYDVPFPPVENPKFTFIDLFAGIGGFRIAFQEVEGKCVFSSEWDKYAQRTYEANFGEVPFGDITAIHAKNIPDHDILVGGFPCQPFSIAGVSKKNALGRNHGFLDETQGTLFFDIARIIAEKKPKAFLLENVKNLRSHDKGNTFRVIVKTLTELGYDVQSEILDAKYYVPQHRERIFIAGFRKDLVQASKFFKFPTPPEQAMCIQDILKDKVHDKYTLTNNLWKYLQEYAKKHKAKGNGFGYGMTDLNGVSRTLSARYYKDGAEILIPQSKKNPRRLTPEECRSLQGYPETFLIRDFGVSEMQLYKQFGNSVAVPLVKAVAAQLVSALESITQAQTNRQSRLSGKERAQI